MSASPSDGFMVLYANFDPSDVRWDGAWFGSEGADTLEHRDLGEAVEAAIDEAWDDGIEEGTTIEIAAGVLPEVQKGDLDHERLLRWALELLDGKYLSVRAAEEDREPTKRMVRAAKEFARAVRKGYIPTALDIVGTIEVNVDQWRADHGEE